MATKLLFLFQSGYGRIYDYKKASNEIGNFNSSQKGLKEIDQARKSGKKIANSK